MTLIEILFTLTLSTLILSSVITIFLSAQTNFNILSSLHTIQENSYFADKLLISELKKSGYIGCPRLTKLFPLISFPPYMLSADNKISGTKSSVTIRHVNINHSNLIKNMSRFSIIYCLPFPVFARGDILLISSCNQAEIFEVKQVKMQPDFQIITTTRPLHTLYKKNAEVGKLEINTFFVADTGRKKEKDKPMFALYQTDLHHHKTELVEGIDELQTHFDQKGLKLTLTVSSPLFSKDKLIYVAFN